MFVRIQTCHCRNTCRRKSGRTRGCVCRDNGFPCSANCGPEGKPCSNRKEISSNAPAAVARLPTSAFDRHQAAAAKSREEIGVRNATKTMLMIAMNNNVSQPQSSSRIINSVKNFSATVPKIAILPLCLIIASIISSACTSMYIYAFLSSRSDTIKLRMTCYFFQECCCLPFEVSFFFRRLFVFSCKTRAYNTAFIYLPFLLIY